MGPRAMLRRVACFACLAGAAAPAPPTTSPTPAPTTSQGSNGNQNGGAPTPRPVSQDPQAPTPRPAFQSQNLNPTTAPTPRPATRCVASWWSIHSASASLAKPRWVEPTDIDGDGDLDFTEFLLLYVSL